MQHCELVCKHEAFEYILNTAPAVYLQPFLTRENTMGCTKYLSTITKAPFRQFSRLTVIDERHWTTVVGGSWPLELREVIRCDGGWDICSECISASSRWMWTLFLLSINLILDEALCLIGPYSSRQFQSLVVIYVFKKLVTSWWWELGGKEDFYYNRIHLKSLTGCFIDIAD